MDPHITYTVPTFFSTTFAYVRACAVLTDGRTRLPRNAFLLRIRRVRTLLLNRVWLLPFNIPNTSRFRVLYVDLALYYHTTRPRTVLRCLLVRAILHLRLFVPSDDLPRNHLYQRLP